MKKRLYLPALLVTLIMMSFSCQRELFFDVLPSQGSLKDSVGNCLPKTIAGTYSAATPTTDSNFIKVAIAVTRAGAYTISTDTVNGYWFLATGSFADTGLQEVKLQAKGTPASEGLNVFTASYNGTSCLISITVSSDQGGIAQFTLQGAPDTCAPFTIRGSYIKDYSMNGLNTVTVSVNASVGGTYSISTNEVNGYKFFSNGTIAAGVQDVILQSIGTPLNAGTDVFTVTAGNSACSFSISVTEPVIVTGTDYFPLTTNSYWTYDDKMIQGDTIKRVISDSILTNGNLYHIMHETDNYNQDIASAYRKTGNEYFQYGPVDTLTASMKYVPGVLGDIKFLKQNLISGDTWTSAEYTGTLFSGQPVWLQYNFICAESNTAITVGNHSFINVYHIVVLPQVRSSTLNPYNSTSEEIDLYYARGVGLVYLKYVRDNFTKRELALRYWQVY